MEETSSLSIEPLHDENKDLSGLVNYDFVGLRLCDWCKWAVVCVI